MKIQDRAFVDKIEPLDSLDDKEKETIMNLIETILAKKKMLELNKENMNILELGDGSCRKQTTIKSYPR
ncbi:MAG: hypothetical protein R6U27_05995 [Desulfobacterales bacterium]